MAQPPAFEDTTAMILDSIDSIRQRKARPDLVRISHLAEKRYGLDVEHVTKMIEKLVDEGLIIKVDYKGDFFTVKCHRKSTRNERYGPVGGPTSIL